VQFGQCERLNPRSRGNRRCGGVGTTGRRWNIRIPEVVCSNISICWDFHSNNKTNSSAFTCLLGGDKAVEDDQFLFVEEFGMLRYLDAFAGSQGCILMNICANNTHHKQIGGVPVDLTRAGSRDDDMIIVVDDSGDEDNKVTTLEPIAETTDDDAEEDDNEGSVGVGQDSSNEVTSSVGTSSGPQMKSYKLGMALDVTSSADGRSGWAVSWCETRIWQQLLFLLLWDQIFCVSVLPRFYYRAFLNRPLDLLPDYFGGNSLPPAMCSSFYIRRKQLFRDRLQVFIDIQVHQTDSFMSTGFTLQVLKEMNGDQLEAAIAQSIQAHTGTHCHSICWDYLNALEVC
jgi:hypothetical protein